MKINCNIFFGLNYQMRLYDHLPAASSASNVFLYFCKISRVILANLHKNPDPTAARDPGFSLFFQLQASCGRILPSAVNVTTRMGMSFPLAATACRSMPAETSTALLRSMRTRLSTTRAKAFPATKPIRAGRSALIWKCIRPSATLSAPTTC